MPFVKVFYTMPENAAADGLAQNLGSRIVEILSAQKLTREDPIRTCFMRSDLSHFVQGGAALDAMSSSAYVEVNLASGFSAEQKKSACTQIAEKFAEGGFGAGRVTVAIQEYPYGVFMAGGRAV